MLSQTEENYLKALLKIVSENKEKAEAGTNEMATKLGVKPATATDMLKKLKDKGLVDYEKYGKISLTDTGKKSAISILRKHRLWETFLSKKLDFSWDEVHEVAEQLEHIRSEKLIDKLEEFLEYPEFDPHGDPIPKANGDIPIINSKLLINADIGKLHKVIAVKDTSVSFLKYLEKLGITINSKIKIIEKIAFDNSLTIQVNGELNTHVSLKFAESLMVS